MELPLIFLMPISLVLLTTVKETRPNSPIIARNTLKTEKNSIVRFIELYTLNVSPLVNVMTDY